MDIHKNARLSFRSREILVQHVVEQAVTLKAAAATFNVTAKSPAPFKDLSGLWRYNPVRSALPQVWTGNIERKTRRTRQSWANGCAKPGIPKEGFGNATATRSGKASLEFLPETRLAP